jgi:agmatine deiminase
MNDIYPAGTPASLGYAMPPEWAPHQATWFSWPHNPETWPGCLDRTERALAGAVAALTEGEQVRINVLDERHERHVAGLLVAGRANLERISLHRSPTNDAWCRDHGAIFVTRPGRDAPLLALDFGYNAWGGKYPPFDLDNQIPQRMAGLLGVAHRSVDMILEGGSIEVNGAGTLLTTEHCLLNPNRNPRLCRSEIERRLRENLGIRQVLWLGDGIVGDDTDGHVDDLTRFVAEDTVVTVVESRPADENFEVLRENRERLAGMRLADGRPLRIIDLPMPDPVLRGAERLPASYANFYIGNRVVLLPVFGCPQDEEAAAALSWCFPGRRVVPVDCRDVVVGLGTLHCLTQQVPAV